MSFGGILFALNMVIIQVPLYTFHYNFCKIHKTLPCAPAMEAGVTGKVWEIIDIVNLID
jgi:hypothetical protein